MRTGANALAAWVRKYTQVTESTLALTFAENQGDRWRFNVDEGQWLEWIGSHWARGHTPELLDALRHFLTRFALAFRGASIISATEAVRLQSQKTIASVERLCRSLPSFLSRSAAFDGDPFLLAVPGGMTIDLQTGESRKSDPGDMITVLALVAPAPPGTPLGPMFRQFLHDITDGDQDLERTLRMWFGICAQGTARDQRVMFLYGPGGNGKGVLLRTVSGLLGDHAVNAPRDLLMVGRYSQHATHLIDVLRSRMSLATEIDEDAEWDTALLKEVTGGDLVSVNRMRHDPFRVKPRCTITVSGNKKPALRGLDDAVRRRFLVATFRLRVERPVPDLEKAFLEAEGPSILRWIVDGSVDRCQLGELYVAPVILADTEEYFQDEDVLKDFLATYLEPQDDAHVPNGVTNGAPWMVKTSEVYAFWKAYCAASGRPSGAQNAFTTAVASSGVIYKRTKEGRYFMNVRLGSGIKLHT